MNSTNKLLTTTSPRAVKLAGLLVLLLLIGISQARATQTVRELFDKIGNSDYISIDGLGSGGSSVGLQGTWAVSPQGTIDSTNATSTCIVYKDTWSLDWPISPYQYDGTLLGHNAGQNGLLNFNAGGNLNATLIDPETGLPFGNYAPKSYATRPLTPGAQINFQANGTYYFCVRIVKGYPWNAGDNSMGLGFSTGGTTNDHFVGVGVTRTSTFLAADGLTELTNTSYISAGTLGQAGITGHEWDSGGPYYPNTNGPAGLWAVGDGTHAGLLVGQLTTTSSGASTLKVKSYLRNAGPIDLDPNLIAWDATYDFTETNVMTQLLVWMHGTGASEYDAIRVGTSYGDVIGFELIGAPQGSPANTNYAGTTVTISQNAGLNTGPIPMSFQWRSNGVDIVDATNATLVLTGPTTDYSANYSVAASNYYGSGTSPETYIMFLPAVPPFFTMQPQPVALSRYVGASSATFTVAVDGTPPYTYQWEHAGTNIGSPTTTTAMTNTLTIAPITVADAGSYTVTVTNQFGSTNSAVATLSVIIPSTNSYAAALLNLPTNPTNLFGYWRMDDALTTNYPTLQNYWNGLNGSVNASDLGAGKIVAGVAGAPYPAFPTPHLATELGANGGMWWLPYRVDLYNLPSAQTNMTFTMWVKGGVRLMARNFYGQGYGLENQGGNAIRFYWGAYNSTNGVRTAQWDTGLSAPQNEWTFVALVVNGNNATVHVGSKTSFTSASTADIGGIPDPENGGYMTLVNSTTIGESNLRLGVGRNPIPWADDGGGAPWTSTGGTWSDIAVMYQALTPAQVKGLFVAGAGLWIDGTPDGSGNLILNWVTGYTLQEASVVTGPWTDIGAATPPNYSVPISPTGSKFYRVKPVGF
ncbi:MAG: hypothetical protein EPO07_17345 [Verrucomicrobia bacterium]|nr:MAG: hypothetical protein EPO07_17345 [Verrucomicrobiota bacterium]